MIFRIKRIISYIIPITIEKRVGQWGTKLEVALENGRYVLNTSSVNYSFGGLHKVFDKAFKKVNIHELEINEVLILGFGAGSVAELLVEKYKKDCKIIGVEKDEAVVTLANKYFNIKRFKNLTIKCMDGFEYIKSCNALFDLIVIDVFVGSKVPPIFETELFIKEIKKRLNPKGIILYNRPYNDDRSKKETNLVEDKMKLNLRKVDLVKISAYGLKNAVLVYKNNL